MPPTLETSGNLSLRQKKRLKELILEKLKESEMFGQHFRSESKKPADKFADLKTEMPVALDTKTLKNITLKDFLENEFFPLIEEAKTFEELKQRIGEILRQAGNDSKLDLKQKFLEKSLKIKKIFDDACIILEAEVYDERMRELAGKLKGDVGSTKLEGDAKVIPLFDPEGRKR